MHISALPSKGAYAAILRKLREADPDAWAVDPFSGWARCRAQVSTIRAHARRALDRRINSRGGLEEDNEPIDCDLMRDARDLDDCTQRRIRVYHFRTPMMRERFGHLLARHDD